MSPQQNIDAARLQKLLNMAKFGWWKADFHSKNYICSDYIIKLLNLPSEILPFEQFRQIIQKDYRDRISHEFISIPEQEAYEQSFPIESRYGDIWIHSKLGEKEVDADGHLVAWGFIQCITDPHEIDRVKAQEKFDQHLHQQNKISRLLFSFLKAENTDEVVYKILQNLLEQYHGGSTYIFEYNWEENTQHCRYEVTAEGISSQQELLSSISANNTPWWTRQISSHKPIILFNLDELPPEAEAEKNLLEQQNIKSLMVVPMVARDRAWGYMGIDIIDQHRNWTNEDYQWFATLGNIISICMELHQAKNKAQKEQEYFKNLYDYMPIGYARMKLIRNASGQLYDYQFIDLNPAFEKLTGVPVSFLLGKTARESGLPLDVDEQIKFMADMQGQDSCQVNFKSNDLCLRSIVYSLNKDEVVSLFSDITDIQDAHEALNRGEKELRNLYKNLPVGIEIYDKNGILRDINDKDIEIFGLKDKADAIGLNISDNPNIPDEIKQKIKNQENVDFKIKYHFSQVGEYYKTGQLGSKDLIVKVSNLYNSDNQLENHVLIIIDNTETSTAYSKIQEFENFFSMIADFAKLGYFKWNPITKTGFALSQWFKNWGEPENSQLEDVVGNYRMLHPSDRQKVDDFYSKYDKGEVKSIKEEVRIQNGQGGWKWIRVMGIVKKFDPANNDIELIGVNFDITEMKEIEAKLTEAKNKAETLDKLKSAFLANMSHEIRTPLNAIVGFSNLLAETQEPAEQQQYISIIQENNDLLLQLISDILDLSKMEAGTFEIMYGDVDVNMLCDETVRSLRLKTPPHVTLEFENQIASCHIMGDRNRIMQIITNFINNALKFTSRGSIRLGYNIRREEIEFYVSDTGIGIAEKNLSTVFDRFVKLNSFIHGTGLGLSICKNIIEQMEGKIGVESEEGKGSRFWFTLPYRQTENEQTTSDNDRGPNSTAGIEKKSKPTLLVAEDTESNFILISTILKKEYIIHWAHNGVEAVDMYREFHPDLILMDIRMPEMDGLEATRQIRKEDKKIPVIALTAFAFDSDKSKALDAGCNSYMTKPVNTQSLKDTIRELLK